MHLLFLTVPCRRLFLKRAILGCLLLYAFFIVAGALIKLDALKRDI